MLVAPDGWASSAAGLAVALLADDLTGTDPVRQRVVDVTAADGADFLAEPDVTTLQLAGDPVEVTVAGFPAFAVTFTEQSPTGLFRATTTLVVNTGDGTTQVFLLQAPAVSYFEVESTLINALQQVPLASQHRFRRAPSSEHAPMSGSPHRVGSRRT